VLAYLSRYTHRVAIANSRITEITSGSVSFRWKGYRHHGKFIRPVFHHIRLRTTHASIMNGYNARRRATEPREAEREI
jgi:hypothetical protein